MCLLEIATCFERGKELASYLLMNCDECIVVYWLVVAVGAEEMRRLVFTKIL